MTEHNFLNSFTFKNGLPIKNRVVMAPMTTMTSFYNGMVTTDEINYYAARAGGPGMIITGVAYVSENGKGFEGELSAASDEMIPGLTKLATTIKKDGSKAILQIFHAGRKTTSKILRGTPPVSASPIAASYPADSETPQELTESEINTIIDEFGEATRRAILAGFDGVELHGANTYLLQQFFSENSNRRTDKFGGSRENRMTFPLAVIRRVKAEIETYATTPFLLGYRISPEEIEVPGIRLEDSLYFVEKIQSEIDYLHLSIGSYKRTSLNNPDDTETLLSQFANVLTNETPLIGVGSVENPQDAEAVLSDGAQFVAIGRELIREPKWVQKVAQNDLSSIRTQLSPLDLEELAIPSVMQHYLTTAFKPVMNFTGDGIAANYQNTFAPMEGFEKKL